jgi:hypothetical protein
MKIGTSVTGNKGRRPRLRSVGRVEVTRGYLARVVGVSPKPSPPGSHASARASGRKNHLH